MSWGTKEGTSFLLAVGRIGLACRAVGGIDLTFLHNFVLIMHYFEDSLSEVSVFMRTIRSCSSMPKLPHGKKSILGKEWY